MLLDNPLSLTKNSLRSRSDLQQAVRSLWQPLYSHYSPGGARIKLGESGFTFDTTAAELEGSARPLWGLAPLVAGGGHFDHWELYREGLINGTNPHHPEYWGQAQNRDQRLVEMAAIGLALALVPEQVWEPLEPESRTNLVVWLYRINEVEVVDNNWLFFRVLVNLGLAKVGAKHDMAATEAALDRLENFYLGEGWYSDGPVTQIDYYVPFAFHFYGLIYAKLNGDSDPARAARFRERAGLFAQDFAHWFTADGAALPFGRSLTYRFAQGSFWGALAFAGVEALPWGVIKGLALRHLRWWARQPIFNPDGTLSIGYTYPNLNMAEQYNSPGSPYWALKFFLPLALPDSHPFWQAEELPLPELATVKPQPQPGMLLCSDPERRHIFALSGKQYNHWARHGEAKYAKFAYSTAFGFSVSGGSYGLESGGYDNVLALSEDDRHYRVREEVIESGLDGNLLYSRWQPWHDVEIETWLTPVLPWYVRIHRLQTSRLLYSTEGGFAVSVSGNIRYDSPTNVIIQAGAALATYSTGWSGLRELNPGDVPNRNGHIYFPHPNTNLLAPRTAIPVLRGQHQPGEHWLACAVLGLPEAVDYGKIWSAAPNLERTSNQEFILTHDGTVTKLVLPLSKLITTMTS
jgi:hypothetical protein